MCHYTKMLLILVIFLINSLQFYRYDKREDISTRSPELQVYSHLLMEANDTKIQQLHNTHEPLVYIEGFNNIAFSKAHFPPVRVHLARKAVLMQSKTWEGTSRET